jgi:hypothetical protein
MTPDTVATKWAGKHAITASFSALRAVEGVRLMRIVPPQGIVVLKPLESVMLIAIDSIVAANRSLVVAVRGTVPNGRHVFRMEVEHLLDTVPAVNVWHLEAEFYDTKARFQHPMRGYRPLAGSRDDDSFAFLPALAALLPLSLWC